MNSSSNHQITTNERITAKEYLQLVGQNKTRSTRPRRQAPEEQLHRAVFEWIFLHQQRHPILYHFMHVPNGGARSKGEAGKMKAMGVRRGVSDILCPFGNNGWAGFACELKAPKQKPTPEQRDFLKIANDKGYLTGVCDSMEGFLERVHVFLGEH